MLPQNVYFKAFNASGDATGDAANITASVSLADGTFQAIAGTPVESSNGIYRFELSATQQTLSNATFSAGSSTSGVSVLHMEPVNAESTGPQAR